MDNKKEEINVVSRFKIKVGATELELSKDDAEALYNALFIALGKSLPTTINIPYIIKEIPYWEPYKYKWNNEQPYTIYCSDNTNNSKSWYANENVSLTIQ